MNSKPDLWWLWILRSAATAAFAMIVIAFPPLTTSLAIYLYGGYVKLDGFLLIGLNTNGDVRRPWLLIAGVLGVASGVAILLWPVSHSETLLYLLAAFAGGRGMLEAAHTITHRNRLREYGPRIMSGGIIALFGLVLAAHEPLSLRVLFGAFAVHAAMASACQFMVGLEQWSRRLRDETSRTPRSASRRRAPLSGLPV
jgi:uncharacterized membrane protein HdeD (DUF308 family)